MRRNEEEQEKQMAEDGREQDYTGEEQYQKELTDWGKAWVFHYCKAAVDTSLEGDIAMIKGKILYKKELARLNQTVFSLQEKKKYQKETKELMGWLARIREKGQRYIAGGGMLTLEYLFRMFGFDAFERYLFFMAFMAEADPQFERIYVLLQDDFGRKTPTAELCIAMYTLDDEERHSLRQKAVRRWPFISRFLEEGQTKSWNQGRLESVLKTPLYLDRRIVQFLYDMDSEDPVLKDAAACCLPSALREPMVIRQKLLETAVKMFQAAQEDGFLYLSGEQDIGKKYLIRHLAKALNRPLLLVDMRRIPETGRSVRELVRRLAREAVLKGNAIVCLADLEWEEESSAEVEQLLACLEETDLVPVITSAEKWRESVRTRRRCIQLEVAPLTLEEREAVWEYGLSETGLGEMADCRRLAATYQLPPGAIRRVIREAEVKIQTGETIEEPEKLLYRGCQRQLVHRLGQDAAKVPAQYTMEDLVLPQSQKKLLLDACDMVKHKHLVFDTWGFSQKMAYGKGVAMIFYGPPGTGKTMGAQAMANELNLELYRVDMASVLSKYVGESEKKLGNIFDQGQKSQSILFFDEADALFGKRSEAQDAQDKYANASTAFLLQKLEDYQGIIILATNLLQNFDQAFCRRFQFIVEFPFPDERRRLEIWRRVFPAKLPAEELDLDYLAEEFVLSGSQIKNIAVGAAFLAAGEDRRLGMIHILRTIKREMKKTGRNMIASDFGAYYSLMEAEEGEH